MAGFFLRNHRSDMESQGGGRRQKLSLRLGKNICQRTDRHLQPRALPEQATVCVLERDSEMRSQRRAVIPAVTHVDGSARPQTVEKKINPLHGRLVDEVEEHTDAPVIPNTSFDLSGEASAHSPTDATRTFFSSGMDALALGSFLAEK